MKLEFDNLDELEQFLTFCGRGTEDMQFRLPKDVLKSLLTGDVASGPTGLAAGDVAFDTPPDGVGITDKPGDTGSSDTQAGDKAPEQPGEPAKRTRRTKAQIEADKAAAAEAEARTREALAAAGNAEPGDPADKGANPFAEPGASDADRMKQRASELAGNAAATGDDAPETEAPPSDGTVSVIEHLNLARRFIAAHGTVKYNETFALVGLDGNVMGYTPEQRTVHAEALQRLGAAA
jgi:hypothetical protein